MAQEKSSSSSLSNNDAEAASGYTFVQFMAAGAVSKTVASVITYPHGEF